MSVSDSAECFTLHFFVPFLGSFNYYSYLCSHTKLPVGKAFIFDRDMSDDKKSQIISLIRDTIRASEPTAQIILYGSRARGDAREDSDWDVLTIIDKPRLSLKERSNIQYPIWDKGLELGQEINVFPYTRRQWEQAPPSLFKYNVIKEGIAL